MIDINSTRVVGRGLHRKVFEHPGQPDLCIKIVVSGDHRESLREEKYYAHLMDQNISWQMLSRYYGTIQTNQGQGGVFDLIRDYDGSFSRPMSYYLKNKDGIEINPVKFSDALNRLRDYLYENLIITMTLKPANIVYRRLSPEQGEFVVIDNIGTSDFIPVCKYVPFMAKKKIRRKWMKFENRLSKIRALQLPHTGASQSGSVPKFSK